MGRGLEGQACAVWAATAGQQGPGLGSDEQPLVLLSYVIIDLPTNKLIGVEQYVIRPPEGEEGSPALLGPELLQASALTDELVRRAGQPLAAVIAQFDRYIRSLQIDPDSPHFHLVTNGQLPFRQCLHPQACARSLPLPAYYSRFHDLHKDFQRAYSEPISADDVSLKAVIDYLGIPGYEGNDFYMKEAKDMANVLQRMISDGFQFGLPETVDMILEPGICSKDDDIDGSCIVRARGLPWQSSDQDIAKFFRGLNVAKGGVALCLSPQGRRNGEALVRFVSMEHRDMALKRHKHHIGARYIEVYRASGEDFLGVAGGATNEAAAFLSRGAQVIVRMRGLPYDCTPAQVLDFFSTGANPCTVLDGADGVLFVKRADGRATGDAFVLFSREEDAPKALAKHRELIGTRYIELFRSTTAEVQQVLNRSLDPKTYETPPPLMGALPPVPLLPQHVITSGTLKDCIRLRGLPYEAQVEHILKFLDDFANNIAFQGVHMVYNAQGQPSGEAFIQMDSETSAFLSAQQKHNRYMTFGKKQRYIEVFQCSGEDMNLVLTGGMASPSTGGKALSPGRSPGTSPPPPALPPLPPPALPLLPPPAIPSLPPQLQAQLMAQNALLARQGAVERDVQYFQYLQSPYLAQQQQQYAQLLAPQLQQFAQQYSQHYAQQTPATTYQHLQPMKQMVPSPASPYLTQNPYLLFAPRYLPPPQVRQPVMQAQTATQPPPFISQAALVAAANHLAVKRSYESAFANAAAAANESHAAKKPYPGYSPAAVPNNTMPGLAHLPPAYQQYFSSI